MGNLSNIDEIRSRFNISYKEAQEILAETGDDLVAALIKLEEKAEDKWGCCTKDGGLFSRLKTSAKMTAHKKIIITKAGKTVAQIPTSIGVAGIIGSLFSAELAVIVGIGTVAALARDYRFNIVEENEI
jgi:hypothetical protein